MEAKWKHVDIKIDQKSCSEKLKRGDYIYLKRFQGEGPGAYLYVQTCSLVFNLCVRCLVGYDVQTKRVSLDEVSIEAKHVSLSEVKIGAKHVYLYMYRWFIAQGISFFVVAADSLYTRL